MDDRFLMYKSNCSTKTEPQFVPTDIIAETNKNALKTVIRKNHSATYR